MKRPPLAAFRRHVMVDLPSRGAASITAVVAAMRCQAACIRLLSLSSLETQRNIVVRTMKTDGRNPSLHRGRCQCVGGTLDCDLKDGGRWDGVAVPCDG